VKFLVGQYSSRLRPSRVRGASLMRRTVVVVPCFNEAKRLDTEAFLLGLREQPALEFLFVDDGSSDGTGRVVAEIVARCPERVHFERLATNSGKAEAVRLGLQRAFALGPECVGYLDADLATPVAELAPMADAFEDSAVLMVLASRVALLGRDVRRSAWRHYGGRGFATAASLILGLKVYDTQCGAKLFRNCDPVRRLFERPFISSWAFDVEILARLLRLEQAGQVLPVTRSVVEVPVRRWSDVAGSKIGLGRSILTAAELPLIWWRYRR